MQLVRLSFQKGHNRSDKDIPLSIRLLGLRKIFEICRHTILVEENKMLLDMSALKISFAWIHLACNAGFCFSLHCGLLRINPNPVNLNSQKAKCSWWTSNAVFPKWLPMLLLPGKTSGRRWQFPQWVFVSSLWWHAGDGMHGTAPFWQSIKGTAVVTTWWSSLLLVLKPGLAVMRRWPRRADVVFAIMSSAAWSRSRQHHEKS